MINRAALQSPTPGWPTPVRPRFFFLQWLYRIQPAWFKPRRICSWCDAELCAAGLLSGHKTTHGICSTCSRRALEESRSARRLAARLAFLFFTAVLGSSCSPADDVATVRYHAQVHSAISVTQENNER